MIAVDVLYEFMYMITRVTLKSYFPTLLHNIYIYIFDLYSAVYGIISRRFTKFLNKLINIDISTVVYRFVVSTRNQRIPEFESHSVRVPPRQGILSTIVSLNPGVVNGYLAGFFLKMPQRQLIGCRS